MGLISDIFTWWNGSTLGTRLYTSRNGVRVGEDEHGHTFYRSKDGKRRWVIFKGEAEASHVSPEWHGWLHHTYDEPPTEAPLPRKDWEKPHVPNMTGTTEAWRPSGSILTPPDRKPVSGDYQPWQPE
ncbi:MAG: NADH:ubiquinone oxidoreductase subunit NDUFA12 [Pseudomonadota bacterium]